MKRFLTIAMSMLLICSAFSCGTVEEGSNLNSTEQISDYAVGGMLSDYETDDDLLTYLAYGADNDYPYEELLNTPVFASYFSDISERYPDAYAAKPFKAAAFSKEEKGIYQLNFWYVPIMSEERCVGIIGIDCRDGKPAPESYRSSNFLALGKIFDIGDCALLTRGSSFYGIFRDNTVVKLGEAPSYDEYKGTLTFDELDQGYNLVTPESLKEVVYKPEK